MDMLHCLSILALENRSQAIPTSCCVIRYPVRQAMGVVDCLTGGVQGSTHHRFVDPGDK